MPSPSPDTPIPHQETRKRPGFLTFAIAAPAGLTERGGEPACHGERAFFEAPSPLAHQGDGNEKEMASRPVGQFTGSPTFLWMGWLMDGQIQRPLRPWRTITAPRQGTRLRTTSNGGGAVQLHVPGEHLRGSTPQRHADLGDWYPAVPTRLRRRHGLLPMHAQGRGHGHNHHPGDGQRRRAGAR